MTQKDEIQALREEVERLQKQVTELLAQLVELYSNMPTNYPASPYIPYPYPYPTITYCDHSFAWMGTAPPANCPKCGKWLGYQSFPLNLCDSSPSSV